MQQLYNINFEPKKIQFESNSLANPKEVNRITNLFIKKGYKVSYPNKAKRDTILTLQ